MRPTHDEYFLAMALLASTRGTCIRRRVGCIIVDERNHVLATGYNGPPSGFVHCTDAPCKGANAPSGMGLDTCEAIHAEQNALLQCKDVFAIQTVYCTASPCITCVKLLLNTSCRRICFAEEYPHSDAERLWLLAGREWVHVDSSPYEIILRR